MPFTAKFCCLTFLLIYLATLHRPVSGHSPFHDLTNIPINDHDVITNSSESVNTKNDTSRSDDSRPFFDLASHSANDSFVGHHNLSSHHPAEGSQRPAESKGDSKIESRSESRSESKGESKGESKNDAKGESKGESKCELITLPMCKGIGYNHTKFPNQLNQDTQEEAGLEVHQFYPLVEINCSDDLQLFLCLIYAPVCMEDFNGEIFLGGF